jgi:hypothetical protein
MTARPFDPDFCVPALACATGIDRSMRDGSMQRTIVATHSPT